MDDAYLLLGQMLAVQRTRRLADVHESLNEPITVGLRERNAHVKHLIRWGCTLLGEPLWDNLRLEHLHGASRERVG